MVKPPVKSGARKPAAARKTARGRMSDRASVHEHALAPRNMSLRTAVASGAPLRPVDGVRAPRSDTFDPAALEIRIANPQDYPAIRKTLDAVFGRSVESRLVADLREGGHAQVEALAVYEGVLAGYVLLSRLAVEVGGRKAAASALAPLAVSPKFAGLGIATRLIATALPMARTAGASAAFVLGKLEFYQRFGFSSKITERFASPWPGRQFMALEFEPGALRCESGSVAYPQPFAPFL
ncbi:MAG: N-acetyltransferase [Alphaproteobacteria bacterium]|nr:N-acetyltransferase [Alphaproteobacteria bacterium]